METMELKFILRLMGFAGYRARLSQIELDSKTSAGERNKICRNLCNRGLINSLDEIVKLKIAPPGKALLKLQTADLPITDLELKALQASAKAKISPRETGIPATQRQAVLQGLAQRGLIQVDTVIKEVWLTAQGHQYFQDEYTPKGTQAVLTLDMLNAYLKFLRQARSEPTESKPATSEPAMGASAPVASSSAATTTQMDDQALLRTIQSLDHELGTENYLPIFHLRAKLQPPLSRDELDQALYKLQRQDRIELSSLQEAIAYTPAQIDMGIPQDIGGPLFFISLI
ncbi:MAG: hypothetical protein F6K19_18410 [Cyanothece sp. SIO1E1]|nr:hypothetical protein [Cyanothece sp. SIO1E1]